MIFTSKQSKIIGIASILLNIVIFVIQKIFSSYDGHLQLAIAPFLIPAITTGISALGNLFSGDDRKEVTREDLEKWGYNFMDTGKAKGDLARMISARIKGRRAGIDARNSQAGLNNPTDVYSNEEDLINSEQEGLSAIDRQKEQENNAVAMTLAQMNQGYQPESAFSKLFEGGIAGANIGFGLQGILNKGIPDTTNEPVKLNPDATQPEATGSPYQSLFKDNPELMDYLKRASWKNSKYSF